MKTLVEKFMEKVVKIDGCWVWGGSRSFDGYGHIMVGRKSKLAHRISYELFIGPIPEGHYVCHKCDHPYCVNPDHLFSGTASDNMADKVKKGRAFVGFRTREERAETMQAAWSRYSEDKREEIAAKIAAAKTGVPMSPEHLASIRRARAMPRSAEYRQKLGAGHKGVPSWNKGIPMTEEAKEKLSAAKMGRVPWNKGKEMSEGQKEKLSAAHLGKKNPKHSEWMRGRVPWNKGIPMTAETREKVSAAVTSAKHKEPDGSETGTDTRYRTGASAPVA
jgi:hypothetical protein